MSAKAELAHLSLSVFASSRYDRMPSNGDQRTGGVQLRALLNRVEKHKGFAFETPRFGRDDAAIERIKVPERPRKVSRGFVRAAADAGVRTTI